jgi:mRNA interferase MazF
MEEFVKGDIVVVPFPFSDLSTFKRRPAFVLAQLPGPDIILCQITSKQKDDIHSIEINTSDFKSGGLNLTSYIRPARIFTAEKSIIQYKVGTVHDNKLNEVRNKFKALLEL